MSDSPTIADRLAAIRTRIADAAQHANRPRDAATLVAVSKTHGPEAVEEAIAAGQLVFGENRVQEAAAKFTPLKAAKAGVRLHIIGPLQTNKTVQALRLADVIETLDRPRLAEVIAQAAEKGEPLPELLVQVNIGEEPQKAGIPPGQADAFITECRARFGEKLTGLMCIPPAGQDPAPHFSALAAMADRHRLPVISMGMSSDYEVAIRHGATQVRVGSALFGNRPPPAVR